MSSISATRWAAGASRDAIIRPTWTIFSPSSTTGTLAAAFSILFSTTTVCGQRVFPSGAVGHHGRVLRILAMEDLPRTAVVIELTASRMSVSGLVDASRKSMTTTLESALGMTATGGCSVLGQLFTDWRLRPQVGIAVNASVALSMLFGLASSPPLTSTAGSSAATASPETAGVGALAAAGKAGVAAAADPEPPTDFPEEDGAAAGGLLLARAAMAVYKFVSNVESLGAAA